MNAPREQEDSIKDRKKLLYDNEDPPISQPIGDRKPFALYLRETPPQPLSAGVKALLWAVGVVVALLLVGAVWKSSQPKARTEPAESSRGRS